MIGNCSREEVSEMLRKAVSREHVDAGAAVAAIEGLLVHHEDSAAALAYSAWSSWARDKHLLSPVIIKIDPIAGAEFLIEQVIHEPNIQVRRAVAIQLREHPDQEYVWGKLKARASASVVAERYAAVELMGWLDPAGSKGAEALLSSIERSACSNLVSRQATRSLSRRMREVEAMRLVDEAEAYPGDGIPLLLSVVKMIDPILLHHASAWGKFWIVNSGLPAVGRDMIAHAVKDRERDIDSDLRRDSHGW